jgi:hypothetical protein
VLLLLVSVQALTLSCDLRCSLMGASTGSHASHADQQMLHCHGMSMEHDKGVSLTASDSCAPTGCGRELKAIVKSADKNDAGKVLVSAIALLVDPFKSSEPDRTTAFASHSRGSASKPLAQRPGTSLRI